MSSATVNIYILVFVWIYVFSSQMALVVKNPPANAGDARNSGDVDLIPGSERSPRVGSGNPL